jgi:hypothetical protein
MDIQHGHGHAAGRELAAWTWTRSMDLVMQHGLAHAVWTWTMDTVQMGTGMAIMSSVRQC